ncbi:hypothetical protein Pcinc_026439 [Petrolisthes cinctipes]|uniref:Uncharacterized protein n=1 Tax=Petrolisthes cinctipes TaxID=88211 RepID=A0AAE1F6H3_PETCI|nr:hypothetical protein Pcinc_026439 [Petrolisthes cinctipes]
MQSVFIKRKDGVTNLDKTKIDVALKEIPIISMKTVKDKAVKLVFPDTITKNKAIEALEETTGLAETHKIEAVRKIKPKITITQIPVEIDDSEIVDLIKNKNQSITSLIEEGETMKVLFSKKASPA